MILLIDNYDSFVHNLARYVSELGETRHIARNDALSVEAALALEPSAIIISPGPRAPRDAGISVELIRAAAGHIPLLGVCLGHQCIAEAFGGRTVRAHRPVHGKAAAIHHSGKGLFDAMPNPFQAARYHSLIAELDDNGPLHPTAWTQDGTLMALAHARWPIWGVQFHPESILTGEGHRLIANFLRLARPGAAERNQKASA